MMLIKFNLYEFDTYLFRREVKLKFKERYNTGEIVYCTGYRSWSGLTWDKCYYLRGDEVQEFRGVVKKTSILKLDLYRKEVKMDVDEFKKYHINLLFEIRKILREEECSLMLKTTDAYAEVFYYALYDRKILGILVGRQANLSVYYLLIGKKAKERLMENLELGKAEKVDISKHQVFFDQTVYYAVDSIHTTRLRLTATLVLSDFMPYTTITICHPEHGVERITLKELPPTHGLLFVHDESRE